MADPYLLHHKIAENVYDIGGKLYPVSIRDQMVRGQSIIDRAMQEGYRDLGKEILVIGAGAGGVAAAIRAADWKVRTHLIELENLPFVRQAGCQTRWIDPHEYEWPADHWTSSHHPFGTTTAPYIGHPAPLEWTAQWSDILALGWHALFKRALQKHHGVLIYHPGTKLRIKPRFDPSRRLWDIELSDGSSLQVGMIVNAVGFGAEVAQVPSGLNGGPPPKFSSLAFWQTDRFREPRCGLPKGITPRVVISGGGDGALQDFLRIVTGLKSVKAIYQKCPIPRGVERRIAGAEARCLRAYLWGPDSSLDHDAHRTLHEAHRDAAIKALPKVRSDLKKFLPDKPPDVRLVHSCNHFSQAYALNRFFVFLINEYYGGDLIIPGARVVDVASASSGHTCDPRHPRRCLKGDLHKVTLQPAFSPDCLTTPPILPALPAHPSSLQANVVIVRHGVAGPSAETRWGSLSGIAHPRQLLPITCSR